MRTVIVTGCAGLIGSEAVKRFANEGARIIGIDNDMRAQFFGEEAPTRRTRDNLIANVRGYEHHDLDIRDAPAVVELFKRQCGNIDPIVHTASQPSHDWAARDPQTDFTVNANGTLDLLEAARTIFSGSVRRTGSATTSGGSAMRENFRNTILPGNFAMVCEKFWKKFIVQPLTARDHCELTTWVAPVRFRIVLKLHY